MLIYYLLLFLFGSVVGSFLNVVIYRETKDEMQKSQPKAGRPLAEKIKRLLPSWMVGRSYCDHCKHKINWYDNIPLLSYLLLGGKCRYCHKPINIQYPLVELLTAVEFIWIYWLLARFAFFSRAEGFYSFALLLYWIYIFSSLLVIFIVDLKIGIIPDWVVFPAIGVSILRLLESGRYQYLAAGAGATVFFLLLFFATKKKGMGLGDVKLSFLLGLFLGYPLIIVALFLAFLTGGICAVILIISGKKHFGQRIPFGPFLVAGTVAAKIWGLGIWQWYIGFVFK